MAIPTSDAILAYNTPGVTYLSVPILSISASKLAGASLGSTGSSIVVITNQPSTPPSLPAGNGKKLSDTTRGPESGSFLSGIGRGAFSCDISKYYSTNVLKLKGGTTHKVARFVVLHGLCYAHDRGIADFSWL